MASKVESLIQEFVINLRAAIAQEAAEAFVIAGGGGQPDPLAKRKLVPGKGVLTQLGLKAPKPKKKGGKRTAEEIEAQGEAVLAYLKKNPASNAEAIGAALGMKTAELALPMAKLIKQKAVKHVGERRGRKYSAK